MISVKNLSKTYSSGNKSLTVLDNVSFELAQGDTFAIVGRADDSAECASCRKADDASVFIFVDRDGKRICEVNADELSKKFESGEVSHSGSDTRDSEKSRFSFMKSL